MSSATENTLDLRALVQAGGCGSKIGPGELRDALDGLPRRDDPALLFGTASGDDAAVYQLTDEIALVQTVDFFTPIVGDPYTFGAIAAANALSDCFALGAEPRTALNLVCYSTKYGLDTLREILRGGADKVNEGGAVVVGGHSVQDTEPKFGIAVTGTVHPKKMVLNSGARPGDLLVLTKPIGVGVATALHKSVHLKAGAVDLSEGEATKVEELYQLAVTSMLTLNKVASELMLACGGRASTDITGYGLLVHAHNLALASRVSARIRYVDIPRLPGIEQFATRGCKGGQERNRRWVEPHVCLGEALGEEERVLLCDPQTSGPLLIAFPPEGARRFVESYPSLAPGAAALLPRPAIVGEVLDGNAGLVEVL